MFRCLDFEREERKLLKKEEERNIYVGHIATIKKLIFIINGFVLKRKVWQRCFCSLTISEKGKGKSGLKRFILFDLIFNFRSIRQCFNVENKFIKVFKIFFLAFLGEKKLEFKF